MKVNRKNGRIGRCIRVDRNDNKVADKYETIYTYIIASISAGLAIVAFFMEKDITFVKWALGFAVTLTGGKDIINGFTRRW